MEGQKAAAQYDIANITTFQKNYHFTKNSDQTIYSTFDNEIHNTTWYAKSDIATTLKKDGEYSFPVDSAFYHALLKSTLMFDLPAVHLRPEYVDDYEIAYCYNVGTNLIKRVEFNPGKIIQTLSGTQFLDVYGQFFAKKRKNYFRGIGRVPQLTTFKKSLPQYHLVIRLPFWYSADNTTAFPLIFCRDKNVQITCSLHTDLTSFIRLRHKVGEGVTGPDIYDGYRYIKGDQVKHYLTIEDPDIMKTVTLVNKYGLMNSSTLDDFRANTSYLIRNTVCCPKRGIFERKQSISEDLKCNNPALAWFVTVANLKALEYNNYSNYTTNPFSINEGYLPIGKIDIRYDATTIRIEDIGASYFDIEEADHFPKAPIDIGYLSYSIARDISTLNEVDLTTSLHNGVKFSCDLDDETDFGNTYRMYILLYVYQQLDFVHQGNDRYEIMLI